MLKRDSAGCHKQKSFWLLKSKPNVNTKPENDINSIHLEIWVQTISKYIFIYTGLYLNVLDVENSILQCDHQ